MSEPTVTVTQDPCPACDGSRRQQNAPEIVSEGRFRTKVTPAEYGICTTCDGAGKVVRQVPISQLAAIAADPGRFTRG